MERVRLALAGVGGFGYVHADAAERLAEEGLIEIAAFVEPNDSVPGVARLEARGARRYPSYNDLMAASETIDLVCIVTPIHLHFPMAVAAMQKGLHVFLEKPPAVRIQDFRAMLAVQEKAGCFCSVGFHDMARSGPIALKHRLCEGALGAVRSIRAQARWMRYDGYYSRNNWAGRLEVDGSYALDGPINNSCAHVLNMAAYLTGDEPYEFAKPLWVQAELYRARRDIEGEDTDCLRAKMETGAEVCIHLTQAATKSHARGWTIIGENGEAQLHDETGVILPDERVAPKQEDRGTYTLLRRLVEVIQGSDEPLLMPLAEAEGFVLLSNGAYESAKRIVTISDEYVARGSREGQQYTYIPEIDTAMLEAADHGKLLSDYGLSWAVKTEPFDLSGYEQFPHQWSAETT